jgi:hypothetical protein
VVWTYAARAITVAVSARVRLPVEDNLLISYCLVVQYTNKRTRRGLDKPCKKQKTNPSTVFVSLITYILCIYTYVLCIPYHIDRFVIMHSLDMVNDLVTDRGPSCGPLALPWKLFILQL